MPKIKIDISEYLIFIYKPSNSYVAIERNFDSTFTKLALTYDYKFENISDSHLTEVLFLDYENETKSYLIINENRKHIKVNELKKLPFKTKISLRINHIFGL